MTIAVTDTDIQYFFFVTGNTQVKIACSNHFDDIEGFNLKFLQLKGWKEGGLYTQIKPAKSVVVHQHTKLGVSRPFKLYSKV